MAQAVVAPLMLAGIGYFSGALSLNQAAIAFAAAFVLCLQVLGSGGNAEAETLVGKAAPDVTFTDVATGKTVQVCWLTAPRSHPFTPPSARTQPRSLETGSTSTTLVCRSSQRMFVPGA